MSTAKYAVIETYCDNWQETGDYREVLSFTAPSRPEQPAASIAECEEWFHKFARPALARAKRQFPRATFRLTICPVNAKAEG